MKKYFSTDNIKTILLISSFVLSSFHFYYDFLKPDRAIMSIIIEDVNGNYASTKRLDLEIIGAISNEGSRNTLIRSAEFIFYLDSSTYTFEVDSFSLTTYENISTKYLRSKESVFFKMWVHKNYIEIDETNTYKAKITILYDDGLGPDTKQRSYSELLELEYYQLIKSYGTIVIEP